MRRALLILVAGLGAGACAHTPKYITGQVAMVGTAHTGSSVLVVEGRPLQLSGPCTGELVSVQGLDVEVEMRKVRGGKRCERFSVVGAEGRAARDGVLRHSDDSWWIEDHRGFASALIAPPPELQALAGKRVFVIGAPDAAPDGFGVIRAAAAFR
jgi:hypothetical protein